jgi:prophage DNA circulation protein
LADPNDPYSRLPPSDNIEDRRGPLTAWRDEMLPAHFDGNLFHVEAGSREGGRRIVTHQFPKKETPYSEDMGRNATEFTVRGYCITYPFDTDVPLYSRDYRVARDALQARLDMGGAGQLQLPTLAPMLVVCTRYRLSEEQKTGGYCEFDMQFVEWGAPPFQEMPDSGESLRQVSRALKNRVLIPLPYRTEVITVSKVPS